MYYLNPPPRSVPHDSPRFQTPPLSPHERMRIEARCRRLPSAQSSRDINRLFAELDRLKSLEAANHPDPLPVVDAASRRISKR